MSVYLKLQKVSVALQESPLQKSGKNKFAGFSYFELGDFLPTVNKLFLLEGLCGYCKFDKELATLTIVDSDNGEKVEITSPMVNITMKGANEIQNLGAVETYQRRYLYLSALGIVENDHVDAQDQKQMNAPKLATKTQIDKISTYAMASGQEENMLNYYNIKSFKELSYDKAKSLIESKKL